MKHQEIKSSTNLDDFRYIKPNSAQDCTGLIPAGPVDENELEAYEELYPFLPKIPEGSKYRKE
ncbi:MAG: hypothetical protein IKV59_06140 [Lachnospiraceae bacterium]|nr:hypothetical protein [Lachnospiraceae bacterium]